ncbi:heparinase [Salipiger sp. IMCC34102]|uniref:heparinase II/III family protein n=1 Tax=Salipiger sp. IMCC34102 TaxID=2510647 RepID=UPI00101BF203|nr:heparinase II/III family protein [Salipiger sp. IMCC34102]RYH03921.1 heparinase [Salipiger sp. IMCC34102]
MAHLNRTHARRAARARAATGFAAAPEPRGIGRFARGRQLLSGNFLFAGVLTTSPGGSVWDAEGDPALIDPDLHGFGWLDDLAAVGDARARHAARDWIAQWIETCEDGSGPGWTPELAGQRLIRWISHEGFVLRAAPEDFRATYLRSLGQQTRFLSKRWSAAPAGLPRMEALCGLTYASLMLTGVRALPPLAALAKACRTDVGMDGSLTTRNPEELLTVLTLLQWAIRALTVTDTDIPSDLTDCAARAAATLRSLRHSDGGLARFHGGGRGLDGALDTALSQAGPAAPLSPEPRMGYARLSAGRTSVIADAGPPPQGAASRNGHASTLAFELTSGRRAVIVNCGSGVTFGPDWRRAGRATPSHSTLSLAGYSSSRLGPPDPAPPHRAALVDPPERVQAVLSRQPDSLRAEMSHDGFRSTHGLTHARILEMTLDGRGLIGEDLLTTLSDADKARFDRAQQAEDLPIAIRFHLHPDVDAHVDMGGAAVSLTLKSGEIWVFRHDGHAELSLKPSVYLETGRLKPRPAQQVVLSDAAMSYATRIRWSLTKAQDTPDVIRDLGPLRSEDDDHEDAP